MEHDPHAACNVEVEGFVVMTEYELSVVRDVTERAMTIGVPGISDKMRDAIISSIVLRLRHELHIPAPYLANVVVNG